MTDFVRICEVAPRDGLQNEAAPVSTADKIKLVDLLSATGLAYIETASFVSPRAVPNMADGADVMAGIARRTGITYAALTPNLRGYQAARQALADEVAVFASASESFSQHNINCSIAESVARYREICEAAKRDGMPVRGYVSCIVACPYEGRIEPQQVAEVVEALLAMGCREISLGDTIGKSTPQQLNRLLGHLRHICSPRKLAGHFHDTDGKALSMIEVALEHGLRVFDSAAGGAGGCPFAPGAPGNVATEAVCDFLREKGFETGIDSSALAEASSFLRKITRRTP
jgi:hydroxymethylglutaryl-CoA lyase